MPASKPNKITPCCSNKSSDGDLPAELFDFKRSGSAVKQFTLPSLIKESHEDIKPLAE